MRRENILPTDTDPYTEEELERIRSVMRVAILYALGYLYEHREEADHRSLTLTLRSLLFSIREGGGVMKISLLSETVVFQKNNVISDKIGNHRNAWEDYYTCHATVSGENGQEKATAD